MRISETLQTYLSTTTQSRLTAGNTNPGSLLRFGTSGMGTILSTHALTPFSSPVNGVSESTASDGTGLATGIAVEWDIVDRDGNFVFGDTIGNGVFINNVNITTGSLVIVLGSVRVMVPIFNVEYDEIGFVTEGATFQPEIEVTGTPEILWTFADGTTSSSATPTTVDYGSAATRLAKLKVTPWSAVVCINLGYNGGDEGGTYTPLTYAHPDQHVSDVVNLQLVRSSLVRFLASGDVGNKSLMGFVDFTGFVALEAVEFYFGSIKRALLGGCTSLKRICFEQCGLLSWPDTTDSRLALEDIRGAGSAFVSAEWADVYPNVWHVCLQSSANFTGITNVGTRFPAVRDILMNNCDLPSDHDFGISAANTELLNLPVQGNSLSTTAIDRLVDQLLLAGGPFNVVNLLYNSGPSDMTDIASLQAITSYLSYDEPSTPTVSTPTFNPVAGTYPSTQSVTILCPNATIYYTTDGSTPTSGSTLYTGAISVAATTTIRAIGIRSGYNNSSVASATFTINGQVATPTFSPSAGTYTSAQSVTILCPNATIYYTTDGSTPTSGSTQYTGAISVTATTTIRAIGVRSGYTDSAVASATYTINLTVATPTFSPSAGTYTSTQNVTILCPNASIYYTTDGSTPTSGSTPYTGAISVTATTTIRAIGIRSGYTNSAVASATYTINLTVATPTFSPSAGTYTSAQSVTILCPNATIYYTTDGSTPTSGSTQYTGAISVAATTTIRAIGIRSGYTDSAVASATYTISAGPANRIDFDTEGSSVEFGLASVGAWTTWTGTVYWSDSTTSDCSYEGYGDDAVVVKDFGSSAHRSHYIIVNNPQNVASIGKRSGCPDGCISKIMPVNGNGQRTWSEWPNFAGIDMVTQHLLDSVDSFTVAGASFSYVRIGMQIGAASAAVDQILIDLASGSVSNGTLYINTNFTSVSATARATLASRGWNLNYYD